MDDNDSNTSSCFRYSDSINYGLLYFRCILAIISVLFILSMLAIMVLFKKYQFFTQRLILYLAISSLAYQVVSAMDVTSVETYYDQAALDYCKAIGFITQAMVWWPIIATIIVVFEVFVRVVFDKTTERLEVLYVFLIFFLSPLINWIPFVYSAYGASGYVCWIISPGCTPEDMKIGLLLLSLLYFGPYYIVSIIMVVLLVFTVIVLRRSRNSFNGKFDPSADIFRKKMEDEIRPMIYYPTVFIMSAVLTLIIVIYGLLGVVNEVGYIVIATILSIVFRLQGVFLTLVFVLDPETRKKLNLTDMKAASNQWFRKEDNMEYPARYNARSDSNVTEKSLTVNLIESDNTVQ